MTKDAILEQVDRWSELMPRWQAWKNAEAKWGARKTYHAYLSSPEWKYLRKSVLLRSPKCEACLERDAYQVHHLSYAYKYHEPAWDLKAVCDPCHEAITAMDNAQAPKNQERPSVHDSRPAFLRKKDE